MKIFAESVWYRLSPAKVRATVTISLMVLSAIAMVLGGAADTFWD